MNGRTLSRAIQSEQAEDGGGHEQHRDPRGERDEPRRALRRRRAEGRVAVGGRPWRRRSRPPSAPPSGSMRDGRGRPSCGRLPDVDPRPEPASAAILEPRQRWRLTLARGPHAPRLAGRELNEAWETALEVAGLPLARGGGTRPKAPVAFAAPLPVGMAAEAELMDVLLCDRWPAWRAREALMGAMLPGWTLVGRRGRVAGRAGAGGRRVRGGLPDRAGRGRGRGVPG